VLFKRGFRHSCGIAWAETPKRIIMNDCLERGLIKVEDMIGFYAGRTVSRPLVPPEHVYFSLTNRCSLSCVMCDIPKNRGSQEDELSTDAVKKIILQIKELGVIHLIFSGGEPLLRSDLIELIRYSRENGIRWVDIITNGTLCDDELARQLIASGLNHITVSLDGLSAVNDAIRGEGSFAKSVAAIDKLNYYKQKMKAAVPSIGINFTIMNKNIHEMLSIVEFARSKKCGMVMFQPVMMSNVSMHERKKNLLWPSNADIPLLEKNISKLIRMKEESKDLLIYSENAVLKAIPDYFRGKRPGSSFKCYEGIKRIVIICDGHLWSCRGTYGDLKKDNLRQIWYSEQAQNVRNTVLKCKDHCLQDCVYFPVDISGQVKRFLAGIAAGPDNAYVRERLVSRIDYCINELSKCLKPGFLKELNCKSDDSNRLGVINRLSVIKKGLLK
jgi:MoaA/NifB/PqqE/SkfB family radical SAM enzyme